MGTGLFFFFFAGGTDLDMRKPEEKNPRKGIFPQKDILEDILLEYILFKPVVLKSDLN